MGLWSVMAGPWDYVDYIDEGRVGLDFSFLVVARQIALCRPEGYGWSGLAERRA